jgi:hypothetical protein
VVLLIQYDCQGRRFRPYSEEEKAEVVSGEREEPAELKPILANSECEELEQLPLCTTGSSCSEVIIVSDDSRLS